MKRENIKEFWGNRAKSNEGLPRVESMVNLEPDEKLIDLKINSEINCVMKHLVFHENDVIVDLGAGIGQWTLRFAPRVKKVIAVEYIEDFLQMAKERAQSENLSNIEFVLSSVEDFFTIIPVDTLFISGVLHYLDAEQYSSVIENASNYVRSGGSVFLREAVSLLGKEYELDDKYSEAAQANYSALYRTAEQHINDFAKGGFLLQEFGPFFEDGSPLNKFSETRIYYFNFIKGRCHNEL